MITYDDVFCPNSGYFSRAEGAARVRAEPDHPIMSWRSLRAAGAAGQPPNQSAVIDLGSNSWRLVIYSYGTEAAGTWWKRTDELYEAVRIGEGMEGANPPALTAAAMTRGLETLTVFERFCLANHLSGDDVHVFATSAIRDAANSAQVPSARLAPDRLQGRAAVGRAGSPLRLRGGAQLDPRCRTASCSTSAAAACS